MSKFSFDTVFLDRGYKATFERYCIRQRLVTRSFDDNIDVSPNNLEIIPEPLVGIKDLLTLLTLFESIDSNSSIYNFNRLIECGLIKENNSINSNDNPLASYDDFYIKSAIDLMNIYKKDVIKYIKRCDRNNLKGLQKHSEAKEFWKEITHRMRTFYCISPNGDEIWDLVSDYEKIINNCDECNSLMSRDMEKALVYNNNVENVVGSLRDNLIEGLYRSEQASIPFASSIFYDNPSFNNIKPIGDMYQTVKIHLPNEVNILPRPQTFEDVMRMRNSPYIKSFRKVMSEWSKYISKGEFKLAAKMKKDIIKANHNLEKLKKFTKVYDSMGARVFRVLGGMIPEISISLGIEIIDILEPYVVQYVQNKNGWVLLTKK